MVIHGNNLRNWEAECIAPLLAVFCFLLANLLFSLHDIDFHSQDSGESNLRNERVFRSGNLVNDFVQFRANLVAPQTSVL
jgi:hypothetical protein